MQRIRLSHIQAFFGWIVVFTCLAVGIANAQGKYLSSQPTLANQDYVSSDLLDSHGNKLVVIDVPHQSALPITGTVTATVDTTGLATSSNQTTANSSLSSIATNTSSTATNTAAGSTSANQTSGNQKTKVVDASGNVQPAGDTAGHAIFFQMSDGAASLAVATAAAQATALTALNLLTQPKSTTAVTISDSTDTTSYCGKGLWVGTTGDVAVKMLSDSSASTLKNVPSGTFVPGQFLRVMSTNTTASNIVCFGGTG